MARIARVVIPGVPHHLTQTGNRRQQVFFHDGDYRAYLDLMQEWCGYTLSHDTRLHKFALLVDEGANGKSVFLHVLEALIGSCNVSYVGLEAFSGRFQLAPTVGKLANIIPEVGGLTRPDEGQLKAFVAGDPIQIDRKYLTPIQATPTARITIATNTLPRWTDRSEGIWRRMLLLPFDVTVPQDRQDPHLARKIIDGELPGIFNWAIAGLTRLRATGHFTTPEVSRQAISEYRTETNPASAFLKEECEAAPGHEIKSVALYAAYEVWCRNRGYRPLSHGNFGKEIRKIYPDADRFQRRGESGRCWCLAGIRGPEPERVLVTQAHWHVSCRTTPPGVSHSPEPEVRRRPPADSASRCRPILFVRITAAWIVSRTHQL